MTCSNCGASLESTATTCPVCGTAVAGAAGEPGAAGDAGARPAWETGSGGGQPGAAGGHWQGGQQPSHGTPAWQGRPADHPSGLPGEIRAWGIGAHAATYLAFIGLPVVGPLLVWLIRREHPFVDHHGRESLNFNLSVALYALLLAAAAFPIGLVTVGLGLVPIGVLVAGLMVAWLVLPIIGCVKASNGEGHRYPLTIRFVR